MAAAMPSGEDDELHEAHDINVTPFIDVILVLLIIFMVAAPISTVDLPIDLPTASAAPQKKPAKPVYVSLAADLSLAVGEEKISRGELLEKIAAQPAAPEEDGKQRRIFLRADKTAPYGELMAVLDLLKNGGYAKIALVALEGGAGPAEPATTTGAKP